MRSVRRVGVGLVLAGVCSAALADAVTEAARTLAPQPLNGDTQPTARKKTVFDDPLAGVVINRTVTVQGKDFYQSFTAVWRQTEASGRYTVSIHERPSARWGSEIWVQSGQTRLFHTFLPPARSKTRRISADAVEIVQKNMANSDVERALARSPDLGPEEM